MKLLASDFDNTLWFFDHMKKEDVKAIHQFQKQGHLFGLCTGRAKKGIIEPSLPYHIQYDFYILLSGALILNKDLEVIFEKKIPYYIVKEVAAFLNDIDISIVYNHQMYKLYPSGRKDMRCIDIQSLDELNTEYIDAFSFHYEKEKIKEAAKATQAINEKFGDKITAFQNNEHIDIAAKGCSKGAGIRIIQDYFHLPPENIYGIGDSWNDLPMLNQVTHSFTFTYAPLEVQKQSQYIVHSLSEAIKMLEE